MKRIIEIGMSRDGTIQAVVERLVEFYRPERIYIFGLRPAARMVLTAISIFA